jgi:hypothetical protein
MCDGLYVEVLRNLKRKGLLFTVNGLVPAAAVASVET